MLNNLRIQWIDGGETVDTNLVDFIIDNKDDATVEELVALCEALKKGEWFSAGGGAIPECSVGWAPAAEADDGAVAMVWDTLVAGGWTPPVRPSDAISQAIKKLGVRL